MSIKSLLGRVIMTLAIFAAAFFPLLPDLGPSHILNPSWPAHARLHEVWLLSAGVLLGIVAIYLVWFDGVQRRRSLGMATIIIGALLSGFLVAGATAPLYGGSLVEPMSGPPIAGGAPAGLPVNLILFGGALVILIIGYAIARAATPATPART